MSDMTKAELKNKVQGLGKIDDATRNRFVCLMVGHSRICTTFFGYRYCGRCGDQLGDSLGSYDPGVKQAVIAGHKCAECKKSFKECIWTDKLYARNPFAKDYEKSKYLETL